MAVVGGASWLILLAGVLRGFFRLSIFDLLFLLAPWVMAPLGLNLVAAQADRLAQMNVLVVRYLLFPAAALALLRSEEHTSELQSRLHLVCRLLLGKKKDTII